MEKMLIPPNQATYSYQTPKALIAAELDGGFSRTRADVAGAVAIVDCSWTLDVEGYQYFRAFFNSSTNKGITPFLIDLILDHPWPQEHEAKFVIDTVNMDSPIGLSYNQTAQLEVKPVYDLELDAVVAMVYGLKLFAPGNPLEKLANYDLPLAV